MNKFIIPLVAGLFVVAVVSYIAVTQNRELSTMVASPEPSAATVFEEGGESDPLQGDEVISPDPSSMAGLQAGGSSYRDPQGVFVFLYPSEYVLDSHQAPNGEAIRITKKGATQKGQTELYDGAMVVLEPINLGGKTLSQWVDDSIKAATENGTSELVQPKRSISLNGYPGFAYEMRGLGTFAYLVFQKDTSSPHALQLTNLVADPEQKGYQGEVDTIISTIELLK